MLRMLCIAVSIAFAPAAHATSTEQMEANKKAAAEFTWERFATLGATPRHGRRSPGRYHQPQG